MSIVCGVDFSMQGQGAARAAAALAGRLGQSLSLVHVLEPQVELAQPEGRDAVVARLRGRLHELLPSLSGLVKGPIRAEVITGVASQALALWAREQQGSLLVVSSVGHSEAPLLRLGGTSERLASAADLPVLVVRGDECFTRWSAGEPLRALVGLDETLESDAALRWLEQLRRAGPVDVVVGHVYYPDEALRRYGLGPAADAEEAEALIERDLRRRAPLGAGTGTGEVIYRAKRGFGRVADHLLELAEAERCELIVVGTHRRRGFARMWSVSAGALHYSRGAVAVVPMGETPGPARPPRLRRLLVPTDFSAPAAQAVSWAYSIAEAGGEVWLAHVAERVDETDLVARLRALVPTNLEAKRLVTRTEVLVGGDAALLVAQLGERIGADAIVVASRGQSALAGALLGSVAQRLFNESRVPVLLLKAR